MSFILNHPIAHTRYGFPSCETVFSIGVLVMIKLFKGFKQHLIALTDCCGILKVNVDNASESILSFAYIMGKVLHEVSFAWSFLSKDLDNLYTWRQYEGINDFIEVAISADKGQLKLIRHKFKVFLIDRAEMPLNSYWFSFSDTYHYFMLVSSPVDQPKMILFNWVQQFIFFLCLLFMFFHFLG